MNADEFNAPFATPENLPAMFDRVRAASAQLGRATPPAMSAVAVLCVGRDEAEVKARAAAIGRDVEEMRENGGVVGTPDQAVEILGRYAEAGASRMYLQVLDLTDLHHVELVATAVAPQLS